MSGVRSSVRFPRRIVFIWVRLPKGWASPRRTASTPATTVVATAPSPGRRMPTRPLGGSMLGSLSTGHFYAFPEESPPPPSRGTPFPRLYTQNMRCTAVALVSTATITMIAN